MNEMAVGRAEGLRILWKGVNDTGLRSLTNKTFRGSLRGLINAEPGMEVVGEAVDGREAIEMARKVSPDVVVMDISMPGMTDRSDAACDQ